MSTQLILNVTFDKLSTRSDKTIALSFTTQELTPEHMSKLLEHLHQYSHMMIKGSEIEAMDISALNQVDTDETEFAKGKSKSERLRSVLFLWAKQLGKDEDFETFYKNKMEHLITYIKEKLDETT